jgi:hypothetical protein
MESISPCIQGFIKDGVGEGQRNNAMFNIAVMEHLKIPKHYVKKCTLKIKKYVNHLLIEIQN